MATKQHVGPKTTHGLTLEAHQIVIRPTVTEKGTHQMSRHNAYGFEVHPQATKPQIKAAIEKLFPVRVIAVRTQHKLGKLRRFKQVAGESPSWKKALVQLHADDRIELF